MFKLPILNILDPMLGDKQIVWREDDKKSLEEAQKIFKEKLKDGWLAFKVNMEEPDRRGTLLRDFDEKSEKIIMVPPVQGG